MNYKNLNKILFLLILILFYMTSNFYYLGIASKEYKVATYREFADNVIPRIKKQGLIYSSNTE
jgi:cell division protein FtsI/penicillin-binding protein 2